MDKLYIATPAFNGKVNSTFAFSLSETILLCNSQGIPCKVDLLQGSTLLVETRNVLVDNFLNSDCTHILMIDSDIGWSGKYVLELLASGLDFVGASYLCRINDRFHFNPLLDEKKNLVVSSNGYIKALHIPSGFVLIKRNVFEAFMEKFPDRWYEKLYVGNVKKVYMFFNTELLHHRFFGEDFSFCNYIHEIGKDIWVSPFITIDHDGRKGRLINSLMPEDEIKALYQKLGRNDYD